MVSAPPPLKQPITAIVLAAGQSRRMGEANKLLADVDGKSMVRRVVEMALASSADEVMVVTGHEADRVTAALSGLSIATVHNPHFSDGLSTSVKTGVACVPLAHLGAIVVLGDMPNIGAPVINDLIDIFRSHHGNVVCVPTFQGKRGNPVLWPRALFADILRIEGDHGARALLDKFKSHVIEVAVDQAGILIDVDTPDDLTAITPD